MCRFLAYLGAPITMDDLLYKPENSLIRQSYKSLEREEPLNGDGFGVGWYDFDIDETPGVFISIRPAWNNRNLRSIAPKIKSPCIFAHVRAASIGDVSEENCHPFRYRNLLFMHNGDIGGFRRIKRALRNRLDDEIYDWLQGDTDSEHFFALFLNHLQKNPGEQNTQTFATAFEEAIAELKEICAEKQVRESISLNVAITNGRFILATKYISDTSKKANTLYHSECSRLDCHKGIFKMVQADPSQHAILVVSEKLTERKEDWHEVPVNHFVMLKENLEVQLQPIRT